MVVSVARSHGNVCSQITWSCLWSEHVVLSVARTRGHVCDDITWSCLWSDHMALSVVKSRGPVCGQNTWCCLWPEHVVLSVARSRGVVCRQIAWHCLWSNLLVQNTFHIAHVSVYNMFSVSCVWRFQRIHVIKHLKNLNSSFIIDATLNMRLLPHTKKNKKKKYFLHTCYLSSAGFEPARFILGETLQAGKPYVVPLHQAGAVIMTPSPFLNTRLKDFKMCDQINYIYLRNGRKFPHLSNSPAGLVDPTIAFQPGDPSSVPARGFHNW